jgi:cell division protease FtsH
MVNGRWSLSPTEEQGTVTTKIKTATIWLVLLVAVVFLVWQRQVDESAVTMPYSQFISDIESENVTAVRVSGTRITVIDRSGAQYTTDGILEVSLLQKLSEHGVPVAYDTGGISTWMTFLIPVVLLLAFLVYFLRKSRANAGNNILSLRKSPHREISADESGVTFAHVGGCEDAKQELSDVIDFLKAPQRWLQAGVRLPRGILLEGPPGCGKTLLARAVAGETNAKFFLVSGSEFVEMFVGVGAARVRDLFETAIKKAPSVIFIDEIDALGRRRGSGIGSSHDEREQTLNQLLVCLDGFKGNDRVVVLAATNRPDVLDPALVRPGRIDRRIRVPELDESARAAVLRIQTRGKPVDGVDMDEIARMTVGFNGARLENLCNEAGVLAVRRSRDEGATSTRITRDDFVRAIRPTTAHDQRFNKLDSVMIESATQLAEPTGVARVRIRLSDSVIEGDLVWADASFLKIRRNGEPDILVAKRQVQQLEVMDGTDPALLDELQLDQWAMRPSATA